MADEQLPFTGERFLPECVREMRYEHWARYAMAGDCCAGKTVIDVACGEGYGSALLAEHAASVHGFDISEQAIAHARAKYARDNLNYGVADCTRLPLADASVDVAISFETLEHIEAHEALLSELKRVLRPGGLLLMSSPDKRTYSDARDYDNPYHVRELYREEFEQLLSKHFAQHRLFGQKLAFNSVIRPLDEPAQAARSHSHVAASDDRIQPGHGGEALYLIAACSDEAATLATLPAELWLFDDAEESVYRHYEQEIRKGIHAAGVLQDYEARIAELEAQLAERVPQPATTQRRWWQRLLGRGQP